MTNNDIVQKLWILCDVLRDDGTNYLDYVTETEAGLLENKQFKPHFPEISKVS